MVIVTRGIDYCNCTNYSTPSAASWALSCATRCARTYG